MVREQRQRTTAIGAFLLIFSRMGNSTDGPCVLCTDQHHDPRSFQREHRRVRDDTGPGLPHDLDRPPAHSRRRVGRRLHRLAMRRQVPGVRRGPRNVPVRRLVRVRRGLVRTRVRQAMRLLPTRGGEERAGAAGPDGGCHAGERGVAQRVPDSTGECWCRAVSFPYSNTQLPPNY